MYLRKMFAATCLCAWCELRYIAFMNLLLFIVLPWYNFHCCGIIKYSIIKYLLKWNAIITQIKRKQIWKSESFVIFSFLNRWHMEAIFSRPFELSKVCRPIKLRNFKYCPMKCDLKRLARGLRGLSDPAWWKGNWQFWKEEGAHFEVLPIYTDFHHVRIT